MKEDFGIYVTCSKYDIHFAKASCASIRKHLGNDIPIALITDGKLKTNSIEKLYNVQIVCNDLVKDPFINKYCRNSAFTKLVCLWEGPFEKFLHIDADVVIHGNILKYNLLDKYDFIVDIPSFEYSMEFVNYNMFNTDLINEYFPEFDAHNKKYFTAGVFFGTKNKIDIDFFKYLYSLKIKHPNFWKFGDQGMLNFMLFYLNQKNKLKLYQNNEVFQVCVNEYERNYTLKLLNEVKQNSIDKPFIVHYCGPSRPLYKNKKGYSTNLFTFYRLLFLSQNNIPKFLHLPIIKYQDIIHHYETQKTYFRKRIPERLQNIKNKINILKKNY